SAVCCLSFRSLYFFFLMLRRPLISTLFPYTTLFRSILSRNRFSIILAWSCPWSEITPNVLLLYLGSFMQFAMYSTIASASGSLIDRKSTRLNSSHVKISYAVFCLKKKKQQNNE